MTWCESFLFFYFIRVAQMPNSNRPLEILETLLMLWDTIVLLLLHDLGHVLGLPNYSMQLNELDINVALSYSNFLPLTIDLWLSMRSSNFNMHLENLVAMYQWQDEKVHDRNRNRYRPNFHVQPQLFGDKFNVRKYAATARSKMLAFFRMPVWTVVM